MRKNFIFCIFCFSILVSPLKALNVSLESGVYNSPDGPYVELSIYVYAASLSKAYFGEPKPLKGISTLLTIQSGAEYVKADRFNLLSPDHESQDINFMDIKRYALTPGEYTLTCTFTDLADSTNSIIDERVINIKFPENELQFSTVSLLANVSKTAPSDHLLKNGLYMEHLPFGYYHKDLKTLHFYSELYNLDQQPDDRYFITYAIVTNDRREKLVQKGHKMVQKGAIVPVLVSFDIQDLVSDNYTLRLSVHKSDQTELASNTALFQRSNPEAVIAKFVNTETTDFDDSFVSKLSLEELRYGLKAIAPIVSNTDVEVINLLVKRKEEKSMRFFLNRYWKTQNLADPEAQYDAYMKVADAIDNMYNNGFGYGFETDRGFIYLKYGRPDDIITVLDEPSAPPYEIWTYYTLEKLSQSNVKFLFYNPTLVNNDYTLLHSTAIGEASDPRWEVRLYGSAPNQIEGNQINSTRMSDNFGRNARRHFEQN